MKAFGLCEWFSPESYLLLPSVAVSLEGDNPTNNTKQSAIRSERGRLRNQFVTTIIIASGMGDTTVLAFKRGPDTNSDTEDTE